MPAPRPRLAVTMGDPRGIGPEIVARAAAAGHLRGAVVFGDADLLRETARRLRLPSASADVFHVPAAKADGGVAFVAAAHEAAMAGGADALVTGPIRKLKPFRRGGAAPGHTELLSLWAKVRPAATMLMVGPRLKVALVTNHLPLASVPRAITREAVRVAIDRTHDALARNFGVRRPRLVVLGVNPHAGEGGKLGTEEARVIAPAVAAARRRGIAVEGPLPADSAVHHAVSAPGRRPRWDAVVAMYHDQGLIPAKMDGFGDAVNVSLGLPYVRTSVDHGTAYDIAGKGIADPASLIAALRMARRLVMRR